MRSQAVVSLGDHSRTQKEPPWGVSSRVEESSAGQRGTAFQSSPVYVSSQGLGEQKCQDEEFKGKKKNPAVTLEVQTSLYSWFCLLLQMVPWVWRESQLPLGVHQASSNDYEHIMEMENKRNKTENSPEFCWLQTRQNIEWNANLEV